MVGLNLTGGIPLVEQVECLGLLGNANEPLLLVMRGQIAPVELVGMFTYSGDVALLVKGCGTKLANDKSGSIPMVGRYVGNTPTYVVRGQLCVLRMLLVVASYD